MVAPAVESLIVTDCADEYVPAATENVGVAVVAVIVMSSLTNALCAKPVSVAIATIFTEVLTVKGPVYFVELPFGFVPFVR